MGPEDSAHSKYLYSHPCDINYTEGNKHQHILAEPSGRSGISQHLETLPEVTSGIERRDLIDIYPEIIGGNKTRSHLEIYPEVVDESGGHNQSEISSSVINEIDSNKHIVMYPANTFGQSDIVFPSKNSRSTSSSSSSISSSEDLFQVDTIGFSNSRLGTTSSSKAEEVTQPASDDVSSSNTSKSAVPINASPCPTQSPPIQAMDRSGGYESYDPLRIPSSVFESNKSPTPLEWSVASNESLFSIQIGNNSFSRDHVLMFGADLFKSGELTRSSELLKFNPTPPVPVVETDKKSVELKKGGETVESDERIEDTTEATTESQSKEKLPRASHSYSVSNASVASGHSFAFPVKKKKKNKCTCIPFCCMRKKCRGKKCACPSCYFSNCGCSFCSCTWPSSYFRWPSSYCSNCSWAFCYYWNCSKKRWCCHPSTTLTDSKKNASVKINAETKQQQSPPMSSEAASSKSTGCNWFRCFSCRPSCCSCRCRCCC